MAEYGVTPYALNLIKSFEGYAPRPAWDFKQYSVGYGSRWQPGQPVGSRADHEAALANEASKVTDWLGSNVKTTLTPGQHAALASAGYNLGTGKGGLSDFLPDINAGNWPAVAERLKRYNHAGGEVNAGLTRRRAQEAALLTGDNPDMLANPMAMTTIGATDPTQPPAMARPVISPAPDAGMRKLLQAMQMQQMQALPQSRSWQQALGNALPLYAAMFQQNRLDTQQKEHQKSLADALMGAKDPSAMTAALLGSGDPDLMKAGIQQKMAEAQLRAKAGQPLRGKERFLVTPNGVMDVETNQIVPGTAKPEAEAKPPSGYRKTGEGNLAFIPGGPADPATNNRLVKYNEGQTKAANFGNMMTKAEEALAEFAGKDEAGNKKALENPKNFLGATRDALVPFEGLSNLMTPDETQNYKQLASQWIRAKLRKESGAAIGAQEMEQEFRTYFPQYGDGPETRAAKAKARTEAVKGMIAESGGAYNDLFKKAAPDQPAPEGAAAPKQHDPLGILGN